MIWLGIAQREATQLETETIPWAAALAAALKSGVASASGNLELALRLGGRATLAFDRLEMSLHTAAARYQMGRLAQDECGGSARVEAETWMARQGVVRPDRIADLLVPVGSFRSRRDAGRSARGRRS
jgi:hypothetical protein